MFARFQARRLTKAAHDPPGGGVSVHAPPAGVIVAAPVLVLVLVLVLLLALVLVLVGDVSEDVGVGVDVDVWTDAGVEEDAPQPAGQLLHVCWQ